MKSYVYNAAILVGVTLTGTGLGMQYGLGAGLAAAGLLICALSVTALYLAIRGLG